MSELWERKIRTYFKQFDLKNKGFITIQDLIDMAEKFSDAENTTDAQRKVIRDNLKDVFRRWIKSAGTGDDGLLTPSILIESIRQQRNDPDFKAVYMRVLHHYFKFLDSNGDGYLQEEECARAFSEIGFTDVSFIRNAFECMDVNKDGKVSLEEYCTAIFEFVTSQDEKNPYTLIFGPLV